LAAALLSYVLIVCRLCDGTDTLFAKFWSVRWLVRLGKCEAFTNSIKNNQIVSNCVAVKRWHCCHYFFGGVRLCGSTGTVFGPGFGASGFFLGVGDGVDLLCGFTRVFHKLCQFEVN